MKLLFVVKQDLNKQEGLFRWSIAKLKVYFTLFNQYHLLNKRKWGKIRKSSTLVRTKPQSICLVPEGIKTYDLVF